MNSKIHASSFDEVIDKFYPETIKKTRQRIDIFKVLYSASQPLSAAEIFDALNKKGAKETYAFSTVYRNLLAFEKAGIVIKSILSTEDNAVYELKRDSHLEGTIPDFQITGHQLEIYGYCASCRASMDSAD